MRDATRYKLHSGPYKTPRFRYGATVVDEWRGDVQIVGSSNGKIPWPISWSAEEDQLVISLPVAEVVKKTGRTTSAVKSRRTVLRRLGIAITDGRCRAARRKSLARAIRRESVQAVAYWWGVSPQTVTKWRRRLGIAGDKLAGTSKVRKAYMGEPWAKKALKKMHSKARDPVRCQKIAESRRGKKRPPHVVEAMRKAHLGKPLSKTTREKMSAAHKRRGTRPPWLGPAWSAKEDQLVLTRSIAEVVKKTGRTVSAVKSRRTALRRLGVAISDGRCRVLHSNK